MKKCARCHFEYDDAYDGCPQCARAAVAAASVAPGVPVSQVLSSGKPDYGPGSLAGALLALPLFFVAYIAVGLFVGFQDSTASVITLLLAALVVVVDANTLKKPVGDGYKITGNAGLSPLLWGVVVVGLAVVSLPAYGYLRPRIKRAYEIGAARLAAGGKTVAPPTALGTLSGDAKLAGRAVYYTDGVFAVEGSGEVGQQFIKTHHARGQIAWSNPQVSAWAVTHFGEAGVSEP
jgi:hypothetical protein